MKRIVVVGSGTMGKGVSRLLSDYSLEVVNLRARDLVNENKANVSVIKGADLVIEAARENFAIKADLLKKISTINENGLIGTTTSSLSIESLATWVQGSSRFCGIHFMNPAHKIPVIEFTPSESFLPERKSHVFDFLKSIDRVVFETLDQPGFILNALLFPLLNRAVYILESSGLSPKDIDQMMVQVCGHKLGPLATLDLIGLNVSLEIIQILHERDPVYNLPPAKKLTELVREGKLGKKTGSGFYDY